MVTIWLWKWL